MLRFIVNEPALLLGKALVVADLHLGLESDLAKSGIRIPSQTGKISGKIKKLLSENDCRELIILGDIKHVIPGLPYPEKAEVLDFIGQFAVPVKIIKGNHDGSIQNYLKIYKEINREGYLLTHGHMKIRRTKKKIISGHVHPVLEFRDGLGGRISERVWIAGKNHIIMPAFNDLLGGVDVRNFEKDVKDADLYLLDGLYLGRISDLQEKKNR
jgi:putative SbcD/Mre11-related phosphoesterase